MKGYLQEEHGYLTSGCTTEESEVVYLKIGVRFLGPNPVKPTLPDWVPSAWKPCLSFMYLRDRGGLLGY